MLVVLAGVLPQELALVGAAVDVEVEGQGRHLHHALLRMQPRAGDEDVGRVGVWPALAHKLSVAGAGHIAGPCHQAACALHAERVDQLPAHVADGRAVQQQHALVVQPDAAVAGREEQRLCQVAHRRRLALDEILAVAAAQHRAGLAGHFGQGDAGRLGSAGNAVAIVEYHGLAHGFISMAGAVPAARLALAQMATALRQALCMPER